MIMTSKEQCRKDKCVSSLSVSSPRSSDDGRVGSYASRGGAGGLNIYGRDSWNEGTIIIVSNSKGVLPGQAFFLKIQIEREK